jgi:YD repeat-containing protein
MSVIPRESSGNGVYYLAPSVKIAKAGMANSVDEAIYVDENGINHYGLENIFKTQLKTFGLDLSYASDNARDNYYTMGHWRNSFVSRLDFDINAQDIVDKSNFYDSPRAACESGFNDIKDTIYRGILSDATAVYDKEHDMCIIRENGKDTGKFVVWNRSQKRDDLHYITTPKGEFYVFLKDPDGKFTTEMDGIKVTLSEDENGTYSYKDAKDTLWRYDASGRLVYLMQEGQETHIRYGDDGKITKVTGPMDNVMQFAYNDEGLLDEIKMQEAEKKISANLHYSDTKMLSDFRFVLTDENATEHTLAALDFQYNDKNLLTGVTSEAREAPDGTQIPKVDTAYRYDRENRVEMTTSDAYFEKYSYAANSVTKLLPDGSSATAQISFAGSRQVIAQMKDPSVFSQLKYNDAGKLSELELREKRDANSSENIASNALLAVKTLKLQMDYNAKGLIKSQYLELSDGTKKFSNFEYKTKYNKPTKVVTDKDVTFFDFNNKGQLIKMSYLKYDKDMKLKPSALEDVREEPGFTEVVYKYDENGLLKQLSDEKTGKNTNFIAMRNGETLQGNIRENNLGFWWHWIRDFASQFIRGYVGGVVYDVRSSDTKLALVNGAGGRSQSLGRMENDINLYWQNPKANMQHFYWEQISWSRYWKKDVFNKGDYAKLVVVGHSYGGDSAVEGACAPNLKKPVNLLITLDPVGMQYNLHKTRRKTDYWVNVYADPGRQWPGVKVRWKCHWYGCYPKFYRLKSQWNGDDWIAWAGGKGTYSSYGRHVPADKRVVARTHHGNPCEMIRVLTREGFGFNYDFNFNIQSTGCH